MHWRAYAAVSRFDHWFKNVFAIPGSVLGAFAFPETLHQPDLIRSLIAGYLSLCFAASANYVINEVLDAPLDALHPDKRHRPVPSGQVKIPIAWALTLAYYAIALGLAALVSRRMLALTAIFLVAGLIYNVRPVRSKDRPYLDVLSESVNNPIRFLGGWFALGAPGVPPLSAMLAYWMIGTFFMAVKRYAEFRHLADQALAAQYRKSFAYYTEERLLLFIMFAASAFSMMGGIFLVRYHIELVLTVPFIAGFMAMYLKVGMLPNSPTQYPEKLYKRTDLMIYCVVCAVAVVVALLLRLPWLEAWFSPNIQAI